MLHGNKEFLVSLTRRSSKHIFSLLSPCYRGNKETNLLTSPTRKFLVQNARFFLTHPTRKFLVGDVNKAIPLLRSNKELTRKLVRLTRLNKELNKKTVVFLQVVNKEIPC